MPEPQDLERINRLPWLTVCWVIGVAMSGFGALVYGRSVATGGAGWIEHGWGFFLVTALVLFLSTTQRLVRLWLTDEARARWLDGRGASQQ